MKTNILINRVGLDILKHSITFHTRLGANWKDLSLEDIFKNKKVVIFGLPGAFTPTCSSSHLPRYEELYDLFKQNGIDEIYCVSVNDPFVMNAWAKAEDIHNVKMLPDGNGELTTLFNMLVDKKELGFGYRSWRYSMLVNNGLVIKHFIEPEVEGDPFEVSDADTMLKFINQEVQLPKSITIFTKDNCNFCEKTKELLHKNNLKYNEILLSDAVRQKVLHGITGKVQSTTPQIFIDGQLIGGFTELNAYLK